MRRVQKLQPVGGPGDKIFPPTYPGERRNDPPRHVFETRRVAGKNALCVLIDSVLVLEAGAQFRQLTRASCI